MAMPSATAAGSDAALAEIARVDALATKFHTACGPDARMVWRRWGSGPNLVLVHGGAGSWMHWIRNVEPLSRTHTVWAPDIPGFGESDLPGENLDADTLFPFVLDGLQELLQEQPFDLTGFSFGGLVAALIAAEQPAGLRRLVLVSVAAMGLLSANPVLRPMRGVTDPAERQEVLRANLNALMIADASAIDALAITVQALSTSRERVRNRKLVLTDILLRLSARWSCAAFAVWGLQDMLYRSQIDKLLDVSAKLGLRDRVLMDGVGHWLMYEKSAEFNRTLEELLGRPVTDEGVGNGR